MLLVDTGVFLATADDNDPDHDACVAVLTTSNDELVTTALVVAEAAYLIDRQLGAAAEAAFFRSLANGDARVESLTDSDFARTAELIERYADFPLGGTDTSLVAVAERLGSTASRRSTAATSAPCGRTTPTRSTSSHSAGRATARSGSRARRRGT